MRLSDDFEEHKNTAPGSHWIALAVLVVSLFVGGILLLVLLLNGPEQEAGRQGELGLLSKVPGLDSPVVEEKPEIGGGSGLTPEDLDFWDKYPVATETPTPEPSSEPEKEDPATDGKHTLVVDASGKEEWVLINPYLPKNNYDFTRLVCQTGLMKYYVEGKQVSYVGADVSKLQDYIDFPKAKKAGLDFVMVRVGARGYSSGQLVMDDYFTENVKRATDAGLQVGVYFFSQAISKEEAVEEAKLVIDALKDYTINYPVAFYMDQIPGDVSRIHTLSKGERTEIAGAFLETIQEAGYLPMLYGDKEWLLKQVDLAKLAEYDIWLSQLQDIPDYPYRFTMWQYSSTGVIDGIAGYANLNIAFIDYTEK